MAARTPSDRRRSPLLLLAALFAILLLAVVPVDLSGAEDGDGAADADAGDERAELLPRTVEVEQTTGVERGQVVTVSWEGFEPNERVYLHQCKKASTVWTDCAEVTRIEAISDADGAGSVEFPVWGGTLPRVSGVFGQGNNQISCNGAQCDIVVSECPFDVFPERTVRTNVAMVPSGTNPTTTTSSTTSTTTTTPTEPDPGERITLSSAGSSELEDLVADWQGAVLNEPLMTDLEYTITNSPSGNASFVASLNDFVFSGLPLNETQLDQLETAGQGVAYVPVAVGLQTLATKWELNGIPLRELNLSAGTLAKTYQGDLTLFFEQDFTDDNGGCSFPISGRGPRVGFRTDQSSSNYWFSRYLDERGEGIWELGADPIIPIESSLITGRSGAYNLAFWVANGGTGNYNEAPIAFFDHSWARMFDLTPVHIQNAAGEWVIPTRDGAKAALDVATLEEDGRVTFDVNDETPGVYPLTIVYYAVVPTQLTTTFPQEEADELAEMLTFLVSDEGQEIVAERGFVPLSPEIQEHATEAIGRLAGQAPPPSTTTTTSTTVAPTTTEAPATTSSTFQPATFPPATFGAPPPFDTVPDTTPTTSFSVGPPIDSGGFDGGSTYVDPGGEDTTPAPAEEDDDGSEEVAAPPTTEAAVEDETVLAQTFGGATASPALPLLLVVGLVALASGPVMRFFGQRGGL